MKKLLTKLLCALLLPCLLLCGCENRETKKETLTVCTMRGGAYVTKTVEVDQLTKAEVVHQLALENLATEACTVNSLTFSTENGQKTANLDMNQAFLDLLESRNSEGQVQTVHCVANTFMLTYQASFLRFTVNGSPLVTRHNDFSALIAADGAAQTATPDAHAEVSATPTDRSTATPDNTPLVTAHLTDLPTVPPDIQLVTPEPTPVPTPTPTPAPTPYREPGKKYVALTFDDGPGSYTKDIADLLKSYNANATFFIVSNRLTGSWKTGLQYAYEQGFEIGIHAYTHKYYYDNCKDSDYETEISKPAQAIQELTGKAPNLMRPTGGRISQARADASPYSLIMWRVDSDDWRYKNDPQSEATEKIVNNIMKNVKDGDIILMHEIYKTSYEALKVVLARLTEEGYTVVSVSELIGMNNLKPGVKYYHG